MVLFFTLPPSTIDYPYILINANKPETGIRYIVQHRGIIEVVIIDSGIEIFRNPSIKDYPGGAETWIRRLVVLRDRVKSIAPHARIYVTCPDYCDDYHHKALWIDENITNIERTVLNILKCVDWYRDVDWLIPIQGWNKRPPTLIWSLEYLEQLGVLKDYSYLAVANLCVEPVIRIIRHGLAYVRTWLNNHGYRDHRIHVFGMKISALKQTIDYINSFDSTAWTRPVSTRLWKVLNWSAKSEEERTLFFCEYMLRLARQRVMIPLKVFEQCLEQVPRIRTVLTSRYRTKAEEIEKVVSEVTKDLETLLKKE